jgi:hypothetical protein
MRPRRDSLETNGDRDSPAVLAGEFDEVGYSLAAAIDDPSLMARQSRPGGDRIVCGGSGSRGASSGIARSRCASSAGVAPSCARSRGSQPRRNSPGRVKDRRIEYVTLRASIRAEIVHGADGLDHAHLLGGVGYRRTRRRRPGVSGRSEIGLGSRAPTDCAGQQNDHASEQMSPGSHHLGDRGRERGRLRRAGRKLGLDVVS